MKQKLHGHAITIQMIMEFIFSKITQSSLIVKASLNNRDMGNSVALAKIYSNSHNKAMNKIMIIDACPHVNN